MLIGTSQSLNNILRLDEMIMVRSAISRETAMNLLNNAGEKARSVFLSIEWPEAELVSRDVGREFAPMPGPAMSPAPIELKDMEVDHFITAEVLDPLKGSIDYTLYVLGEEAENLRRKLRGLPPLPHGPDGEEIEPENEEIPSGEEVATDEADDVCAFQSAAHLPLEEGCFLLHVESSDDAELIHDTASEYFHHVRPAYHIGPTTVEMVVVVEPDTPGNTGFFQSRLEECLNDFRHMTGLTVSVVETPRPAAPIMYGSPVVENDADDRAIQL